jgi:hypothetical protein
LEEALTFAVAHQEAAVEGLDSPILKNLGQTSTPAIEDDVNTHFICLVHNNGHIYEL